MSVKGDFPTRNHEVAGLIPGLAQWVRDLALLWLWHRPAATAPIRLLAWELHMLQERLKKTQKKNKKNFFCQSKIVR